MTVILAVTCIVFFIASRASAQSQKTTDDPLLRKAQLPWWDRAEEQHIGHYWIKTDIESDLANKLARHLNLMYEEYARRLASLPSRTPERLNVMIFDRERDYQFVLRTKFGVDGTGTGGIFFANPSGTALAFWIQELPMRRIEHVLQHEGFHQFAFSRFGGDLPPWVNEGLAEFFGEAILVNSKLIIGQTTPRVIDRLKNAIETEKYIPFRTMLSVDGRQWGALVREGNASLQYNQAWSMVHFLVYGDGEKYVGAFEQYLKLINAGYKSEDSFIRAFGSADIEGFERQWKKFTQQSKPSSFVTAMERMEFLTAGALHLRENEIIPESLDALKAALKEAKFTYTTSTHGVETVLNAEDDSLYLIPLDDLSEKDNPPMFVVSKMDTRRMSMRERKAEQENPSPSLIGTKNLEPNNLIARWNRDKDTGEFTVEIDVR